MEFQIYDKKSKIKWLQQKTFNDLELIKVEESNNKINLKVKKQKTEYTFGIIIKFDEKNQNEIIVEIIDEKSEEIIVYPYPIVDKNSELFLPLNQGIKWSSTDKIIKPMDFPLFSGYFMSMPFFGGIKDNNSYLAIVESPDDTYLSVENINGVFSIYPKWFDRINKKRSNRKIRYIFIDSSNINTIAKRFKKYMDSKNKIQTLDEKVKNNNKLKKISSGAHIWSLSKNDETIIEELLQNEISDLVWSNTQEGVNKNLLNKLGYIPVSYENYSDVVDPSKEIYIENYFKNIIPNAWNNKVITKTGAWKKGSYIESDNYSIDLGIICDTFILDYLKRSNKKSIVSSKLDSIYIDNLVSIEQNECFDPDHIICRNESKELRKEALKLIFDSKYIVGLESGIHYAVEYAHYFTGMMSLSPYINQDISTKINKVSNQVTEEYKNINMGHEYRVPLWELIYGSNVTSTWYPGDGNNNVPSFWDKKDLFNILYGTNPLYVIDDEIWNKSSEKIIKSINKVKSSLTQKIGSEMTNFEYLKKDKSVQKTVFSNGHYVIVNFGNEIFETENKINIKPMEYYEYNPKSEMINEDKKYNDVEGKKVDFSVILIFGGFIVIVAFVIYKFFS